MITTRQTLTDDQRRAICREMCDGVPRASPTHPLLQRDIDGAYFTAQRSPTFRAVVADLAGRPSLAIVETVSASRDAWKAYAEHRGDCLDCWYSPNVGGVVLCDAGKLLRDAAASS